MEFFIFLFGVLLFISSIIYLIISLIRKKFVKKTFFILFALGIILPISAMLRTPSTKDKQVSTQAETTSKEQSKKEEPKKTETKKEEPKKEIIDVTPEILNQAFDNEAKGNQTYKGKTLRIKGKVNKVSQTLGSYSVTVGTGEEYDFKGIICTVKSDQESIIAELQRGQDVTLVGECTGKSLAVAMNKCTVEK